MQRPFTHMLLKVFAAGFYQVHAGFLLVGFFIMFGMVPPGQLLEYHKTLMLAFVSSPVMMLVVFAGWLLYTLKSWHYVYGQITAVNQQFLFYSTNAFSKNRQLISWFVLQLAILTPLIAYAIIAVVLGVSRGFYLGVLGVILYLTLLSAVSAMLYIRVIGRQVNSSGSSWLFSLGSKFPKPYFSLFIYHIFDQLKVRWLIAKGLSWLIITGIFWMFADVSHDTRIAGIAILSVIAAHMVLFFENRNFEETWLSFSKNLPYSRLKLFLGYLSGFLILLLPEAIWLFSRFEILMALLLLLSGLSTAVLFKSLLYYLGQDMDKYLQWVAAVFIILFWIIMFRLLWIIVPLNLLIAYVLYYQNYYKDVRAVIK